MCLFYIGLRRHRIHPHLRRWHIYHFPRSKEDSWNEIWPRIRIKTIKAKIQKIHPLANRGTSKTWLDSLNGQNVEQALSLWIQAKNWRIGCKPVSLNKVWCSCRIFIYIKYLHRVIHKYNNRSVWKTTVKMTAVLGCSKRNHSSTAKKEFCENKLFIVDAESFDW